MMPKTLPESRKSVELLGFYSDLLQYFQKRLSPAGRFCAEDDAVIRVILDELLDSQEWSLQFRVTAQFR